LCDRSIHSVGRALLTRRHHRHYGQLSRSIRVGEHVDTWVIESEDETIDLRPILLQGRGQEEELREVEVRVGINQRVLLGTLVSSWSSGSQTVGLSPEDAENRIPDLSTSLMSCLLQASIFGFQESATHASDLGRQ
jgi:hypothetical protein